MAVPFPIDRHQQPQPHHQQQQQQHQHQQQQQQHQQQQQQQRKKQAPGSSWASPPFSSISTSRLRATLHLATCIAFLALGMVFRLMGTGYFAIDPATEALRVNLSNLIHASPSNSFKSSRVHVGRHEILVRAYPHPNAGETAAALAIIDRVQLEQRRFLMLKRRQQQQPIIAITPVLLQDKSDDPATCPSWALLRLQTLANTLSLVGDTPLLWIPVQGGGSGSVVDSTREVLHQSGVRFHHLVEATMNSTDELRIRGLRFVKENKLQGNVVFADISNTHSVDLFDEVSNVKWVGAFEVGFPVPSTRDTDGSPSVSVVRQPRCDAKTRRFSQPPKPLWWSGFAFKSQLLWMEQQDRPAWLERWDAGNRGWAMGLVRNLSLFEPLGSCGGNELVWSIQAEACRGSCRYPSSWAIDPPLQVVVPQRRTPWAPRSENATVDNLEARSNSTSIELPRFGIPKQERLEPQDDNPQANRQSKKRRRKKKGRSS